MGLFAMEVFYVDEMCIETLVLMNQPSMQCEKVLFVWKFMFHFNTVDME